MSPPPTIPPYRAPESVGLAVRFAFEAARRAEPDEAERQALATLHVWLAHDAPPFALAYGPRGSRAAVPLAALVLEASQSGHDAFFVPVGPGTRTRPDLLWLLGSRCFDEHLDGAPRNFEYWLLRRLEKGRLPSQPPLLLAIEGLDETSEPFDWAALLGRLGPRTRCVASFEGDEAAAAEWQQRLGWSSAQTLLVPLDAHPLPSEALLAALALPSARRLLAHLTAALGWVPRELLARVGGRCLDADLARLDELVVRHGSQYALATNALRRHLTDVLSPHERRQAADSLLQGESSYRTLYEGAHQLAQGAPIQQWCSLVSRSHWARWRHFAHAYGGMNADLERARLAALTELAGGAAPAALDLALRATLVEASLNSLARYDDDDPESKAALGARRMRHKKRRSVARNQAMALRAIAQRLPTGSARDETLTMALKAARLIRDPKFRADELVNLGSLWPSKRLELAREALQCTDQVPDKDAFWSLLYVTPLVSDFEALALVRRVLRRASEEGAGVGDFDIFAHALRPTVARAFWPEALARPVDEQAVLLPALALASGDRDLISTAFEQALERFTRGHRGDTDLRSILRFVPHLEVGPLRRLIEVLPRPPASSSVDWLRICLRLIELGASDETLFEHLSWEQRQLAHLRCLRASNRGRDEVAPFLAQLQSAEARQHFGLLTVLGPDLIALGELATLVEQYRDLEPRALRGVLVFLATLAPPAEAAPLAREAFALATRVPHYEAEGLPQFIPIAHLVPRENAVWLLGGLLDELGNDSCGSALAGDSTSCVFYMVPLLETLEGAPGLLGVARVINEVLASWP